MNVRPLIGVAVLLIPGLAFGQIKKAMSPGAGTVSGNTYTNSYFGFSYTFPTSLVAKTVEFERSLKDKGSRQTFVLLTAAAPRNSPVISIMADDASQYGGLKDGAAYLRRFTKSVRTGGGTLLRESNINIDNKLFFRADYVLKSGGFESSVCTVYKGYALDFIVAARSQEDIEALTKSIETIQFSSGNISY